MKNQKQCGSCWSFSTTGSVEGSYAISTGKLTSFSEQVTAAPHHLFAPCILLTPRTCCTRSRPPRPPLHHPSAAPVQNMVSCDNSNGGCDGGLMTDAYEWIKTNGGLCAEEDYPYTAGGGTEGVCEKTCTPVVTVTKYTDVAKGDEDALKHAVTKQPVSIAVQTMGSQWQLYKSGIYDVPTCGTELDHAVLLVGYGVEDGTDYWKIKNSWGATWGLEGYMHMKSGANMCGIANGASYPTAKALGADSSRPVPPSPSKPSHYKDPKSSCRTDEIAMQIQGIDGDFCSPKCSQSSPCPDVPDGVTATPTCALYEEFSKFCVLICSPSLPILDQKAADAQCGENASCKEGDTGFGICTYDE